MSEEEARPPQRRSASAEAAALRFEQSHPDEDVVDHQPPARSPADEPAEPGRRSASAEAAALRWRHGHADDEDDQAPPGER